MKNLDLIKKPWTSIEEFSEYGFGSFDEDNYNEVEARTRHSISTIMNNQIGIFGNGTIAKEYIDEDISLPLPSCDNITTPCPTTRYLNDNGILKPNIHWVRSVEDSEEDYDRFLTDFQQTHLKWAQITYIDAVSSGWRPHYEIKQSINVSNGGGINNSQSAFAYADEFDQLPKQTKMHLRALMLFNSVKDISYKLNIAPEDFVKLEQLIDTTVKLNKTYQINGKDVDAKTQADLNELLIKTIADIAINGAQFYDGTSTKDADINVDRPQGNIIFRVYDINGGQHTFEMTDRGDLAVESKLITPEVKTSKITFAYNGNQMYYIDEDGGKIKVDGIALWDMLNTEVNAKKFTSKEKATNDEELTRLDQVKELITESEGKDRVNDDEVDITALFGTGDITPKTLKEFLDWFILRINGGSNQTNKLNLYFNDDGILELRKDTTPLILFEEDKINFLNQAVELIGDSANPLSALNVSQIKLLVNQLIASANLSKDNIFWEDKSSSEATDANDNTYIPSLKPEPTQLFEIGGNTTGFVSYGVGQGYGVPTTIKTNLLGFELAIGGEEFDTLIGTGATLNRYWKEYLFTPTLTLNKPQDWTITHNIKDKDEKGKIYIKNQATLNLSYVIIEDSGEYKLELNEFVEYTIKHYNKDGTLNKTETGTQYLNDSSFTTDKQPLRVYIIGTGYTSTGNAVGDLSNYFTKSEADARYYQKSEADARYYQKSEADALLNLKVNSYTDIGNDEKPNELYRIKISADTDEFFIQSAEAEAGHSAVVKLGFTQKNMYLKFAIDRRGNEISYYGDYNGYYAIATKQNVDTPYRKVGGEKLWLKNLK